MAKPRTRKRRHFLTCESFIIHSLIKLTALREDRHVYKRSWPLIQRSRVPQFAIHLFSHVSGQSRDVGSISQYSRMTTTTSHCMCSCEVRNHNLPSQWQPNKSPHV